MRFGASRLVVLLCAFSGAGCWLTADPNRWRVVDEGADHASGDARPHDLQITPDSPADTGAPDVGPVDAGVPDAIPVDVMPLADHGLLLLEVPVLEDVTVKQGSPSINFGASDELALGYCTGTENQNMRIWLKFDLSSIPTGASVLKADLGLFFFVHWGTQDYPVHRSPVDSWTEMGLTWANQPAIDATPVSTCLGFTVDNVWQSWDVTSATQQELVGDKKLTLVIQGAALYTGSADHENYARSREYSNVALAPRLQLVLVAP